MAEEIQKFSIKTFDLANEWEHADAIYDIILSNDKFDVHCKYVCQTWNDEDDHSMGSKERISDTHIKLKRKDFISVEKRWTDFSDCWMVEMEINGYPTSIKFYFKDEHVGDCDRIFKIMEDWIFSN